MLCGMPLVVQHETLQLAASVGSFHVLLHASRKLG